MEFKNIGFIGLGAMGFPIAKHLLKSGYSLNIAHHSQNADSIKRITKLESLGAHVKENINEVPIGADLIITILPGDNEVKSVLINKEFAQNISEGAIILDMTSCSPGSIIEVDNYYRDKNIHVIDGPVSGGVKGAVNGTLSIFGSGEKELFNKIEKVLKSFAKNIHHVGSLGAGKALKSINQLMIGINTFGVIEGFLLANKHGIDIEIMKEVIENSSGNSYAFKNYLERLVKEDFEPGFKLSLMRKDLRIALESSRDIPLPIANLVYNLLLMGREFDDSDFSSISKIYFNETV